jgi:DNA-binding NtrC family response regulator
MPGMDGLAFLEKALQCDPGMYVILVTGFYALDSEMEAIQHDVYDYLCKPIDCARLLKTLEDLTDSFTRGLQIRDLEDKLLANLLFHGIVRRSPAMLEVFDLAKTIARHYDNALITGPTGSGKELVAHALHQMSPVSQERFAVCNCSALVDTPLESQLFGHVRGSFTGATETRPGLFEYANGGTVFLDEIGETSLQMQAKLLRVIQSREIQRVGSPEVKKVDVRLIAATNRDQRAEVRAGRFREDLFYRLSSIQLRVPGLAERPGDIPILVQHFVKKYGETYGKPFQGVTLLEAVGQAGGGGRAAAGATCNAIRERGLRVRPLRAIFYRMLGHLQCERWRVQVLPAHRSGSRSGFGVAGDRAL